MTESFLILLAAGIMLAAAISDPWQVTLNWLRLAGIIALALAGLGIFFYLRREPSAGVSSTYRAVQLAMPIVLAGCILAQLAFVQVGRRKTQRTLAFAAALIGILSGAGLLHGLMTARAALAFPPKALSIAIQTLACAGVAAMCGLALMDMLLGHAYLTASQMTIAPFLRLNRALAIAAVARTISAVALAVALQAWRPVDMLWTVHGLFILTRYLVGLLIAGVFIYMAHDCIKRRSTQSATGILYVAGLLVFLGELIGLYLLRETGLPF